MGEAANERDSRPGIGKNFRRANAALLRASRTIEAAYRDLKAAQASLIQAEKMASLGQRTGR